jgi:branched-subunit amino acid aminotransferase/4-amino-4-deoxychorismate lyase
MTAVVLRFDGTALAPDNHPADEALAVADSWLVADNRVRCIAAHRDRFAAACARCAQRPDVIARFWSAAMANLPASGQWFPRAELTRSGRLRLRLRKAPALGHNLTLWAGGAPDPRCQPRVKGPDLAALDRLRHRAACEGATETLLRTRDGLVLEGTTTSLLWWEDDELCVPDPALPLLAGTTSAMLQRRARALGVAVRYVRSSAERLDGREVWMVNALHGIRPVTGWRGIGLAHGQAERAHSWRSWLSAQDDELPRPGDRR